MGERLLDERAAMRSLGRRAIPAILAAALACTCGSPTRPSGGAPYIFVGAGDIANCETPGVAAGAESTAKLIDLIPGTVFTAGDNAYPAGETQSFRDCYEPTWGRFSNRTHPTPGNHDYDSPTPSGYAYFNYFGSKAGPDNLGYYTYTVGNWTIYSLNSETDVSTGSLQWNWLRQQLVSTSSPRSSPSPSPRCTLAIWHRPLFSSGQHGNSPNYRDLWQVLYDFGADVVITGHDHEYERFAPQDADGRPDPARGIREFVVGTGGGELTSPVTSRPNQEKLLSGVYGVLKLSLFDGSYTWEFITATGAIGDSGSGTCH